MITRPLGPLHRRCFITTHRIASEHTRAHLERVRNILQADGYAGFAELYQGGDVHETAGRAHKRRRLHYVQEATKYRRAYEALTRIAAL